MGPNLIELGSLPSDTTADHLPELGVYVGSALDSARKYPTDMKSENTFAPMIPYHFDCHDAHLEIRR